LQQSLDVASNTWPTSLGSITISPGMLATALPLATADVVSVADARTARELEPATFPGWLPTDFPNKMSRVVERCDANEAGRGTFRKGAAVAVRLTTLDVAERGCLIAVAPWSGPAACTARAWLMTNTMMALIIKESRLVCMLLPRILNGIGVPIVRKAHAALTIDTTGKNLLP
jgi:hypothetical protein